MEPNKNYLMVGVFVLLGILCTAIFTIWLTGANDKREYKYYFSRFSESVNGLSVGSPVKFRGVDVGQVAEIRLSKGDLSTVHVRTKILEDAPINSDTVASLKLQGITGMYYIELTGDNPNAPPIEITKGRSIPEIRTAPSGITAVVNRMPEMIDQATALLSQITKVLNDDNLEQFSAFMAHLQSIAGTLDEQSKQLDNILGSTKNILSDLEAGKLRETLQNLNVMSSQLKSNGKGSVDEAYKLMLELKSTSRELRGVAKSLSEKPSQIIFPPAEQGVKINAR